MAGRKPVRGKFVKRTEVADALAQVHALAHACYEAHMYADAITRSLPVGDLLKVAGELKHAAMLAEAVRLAT